MKRVIVVGRISPRVNGVRYVKLAYADRDGIVRRIKAAYRDDNGKINDILLVKKET